MTLVLCAEERGGLSFHSRRQSQDRLLREDLLKEAEGRLLWVDGYTKRQFSEPSERIRVSETPWLQAGEGDLCYLELQDPSPAMERADKLLLYRWRRHYPADRAFSVPAEWHLVSRTELAGYSHDVIDKEVYQR